MTEVDLLEELSRLAQKLNIELRFSQGAFTGGMVRIRGRRLFLINTELSRQAKIDLLCRELARQDLSRIFILPAVRERIEDAANAVPFPTHKVYK